MELYEAVVDTSLEASPRLAGVLQTTFAHANLRLDQFPTHEATSEVCPWQTAMQASILTVLPMSPTGHPSRYPSDDRGRPERAPSRDREVHRDMQPRPTRRYSVDELDMAHLGVTDHSRSGSRGPEQQQRRPRTVEHGSRNPSGDRQSSRGP